MGRALLPLARDLERLPRTRPRRPRGKRHRGRSRRAASLRPIHGSGRVPPRRAAKTSEERFRGAPILSGLKPHPREGATPRLNLGKLAFASGELEHPEPHEVIFADGAGRAHARRWTNRQSGYSAVRDETSSVLIVAEALHHSARADVEGLIATIADELTAVWSTHPRSQLLTSLSPRFEF